MNFNELVDVNVALGVHGFCILFYTKVKMYSESIVGFRDFSVYSQLCVCVCVVVHELASGRMVLSH